MRNLLLLALCCLVGAAPAVELGGQQVRREKFIVYLFIGHSNMAGRAGDPDKTIHPHCWKYDFSMRAWAPAQEPLFADRLNQGDKGGPGMPFLKAMAALHPDCHFGVIQNAGSGQSIEKNYSKGLAQYDDLVNAAKEVRRQCVLGGVVAMLGTVEAHNEGERAQRFLAAAKAMVQDLRDDLDDQQLPFFLNAPQEGATDKGPFYAVVSKQIVQVPKEIAHAALVPSDGPYVDGTHFDAEGHRRWSGTLAKLIRDQGFFPTPAPLWAAITAPAANQTVASGASIAITVDAGADAGPGAASGKVAQVELLRDGQPVAKAAMPPYAFTVDKCEDGVHSFAAKVSDDKGHSATGEAVWVGVGAPTTALMVVQADGLDASESAIVAHLRARGVLVTAADDDTVAAGDADKYQLVLIASSCSRISVAKFAKSTVPVIAWTRDAAELNLAENGGTGAGAALDSLAIVDGAHALAAGLGKKATVSTRPFAAWWAKPAPGAAVIAAADGDREHAAVFAYEIGAPLARGAAPAPARRVGLFMNHFAAAHFTKDGWALFDAALTWATTKGTPVARPEAPLARSEPKPAVPAAPAAPVPPPKPTAPVLTPEQLALQKLDAGRQTVLRDVWPGSTFGLIFVWDSQAQDNRVLDEAGRSSRRCKLLPFGLANIGRHFEMVLGQGRFEAETNVDALLRSWQRSGEFSFAAMLASDDLTQKGPARIVSFADESGRANFVLAQDGQDLVCLFKGRSGSDEAPLKLAKLMNTKPHHLVLTCKLGALACFIDGKPVGSAIPVKGDLRSWTAKRLDFGAADDGSTPWSGRLEKIAFYNRALSQVEAQTDSEVLTARLKARKEPEQCQIQGKLLAATTPPDPPTIYRRTLVVHKYEVLSVAKGAVDTAQVLVAHWAILDGRQRPAIVGMKPGQGYRLQLERFADNPQLATQEIYSDFTEAADLDLPMYYDVGR